MQEELDDIALWSTRNVIETSRFLVLWVAKRLEAQTEAQTEAEAEAKVKIPKMDQTFFSRALKLFAGGKRKKLVLDVFGGDALNEYDEQRPIDFKEFDTEHLCPVIDQIAVEYLTVSRNHVVLNMRSRAWNHFRLFLACLDGTTTLRAADQRRLCDHYVGRLAKEKSEQDLQDIWGSTQNQVMFSMHVVL